MSNKATTEMDSHGIVLDAIQRMKWVRALYGTEEDSTAVIFKPIVYCLTAFGDHSYYAWGWHGQKPSYYRFDMDRILRAEVIDEEHEPSDADIEAEHAPFRLQPWMDEVYAVRKDYAHL